MKFKNVICLIFQLKWNRKIPFARTFSFEYKGEGHYYINKTRYKVEKIKGEFWMKIDNPFLSTDAPTRSPSDIKIRIEESERENFLNVDFYAAIIPKLLELIFEFFFITYAISSIMDKVWISAGLSFLMVLFAVMVFRIEKFFETRHVIADLKTLCD